MSLDIDQVRQVARLARLEVRDDDIGHYASQLSQIMEMVDQLSAAETGDALPMAHPLSMVQRLRPDRVTEENQREKFQANSPAVEQGLFQVPKVIE